MTIYRGFEITKTPAGKYEWTDKENRVHTGMVDTKGGYETEEAAMDAIDAYKRAVARKL